MTFHPHLSEAAIANIYLTAPHSDHLDPQYFPWCADCHPDKSEQHRLTMGEDD